MLLFVRGALRGMFAVAIISFQFLNAQVSTDSARFEQRVLARELEDPWNIIYGPDDHLWINESKGYRVLRMNPADGSRQVLLDLNGERQFPRYDTIPDEQDGGKPWPQGGLMGMAIHPGFSRQQPFVYLAFIYSFEGSGRPGDGADPVDHGYHYRSKIMRYRYDSGSKALVDPRLVCDSLPASNDHNGGRLLIASVRGSDYLFFTIGDMGAGQFKNAARTNNAQQQSSYEGKILRFLLEPAGGAEDQQAWVPADNPFNAKLRSPVWTTGHRNPQGLITMKVNGRDIIYAAEHGPFSDDEISIIEKGKNYGHPLIIGYADGNYNGLAAGATDQDSLPGKWNTTYPLIINEKTNAAKIKSYAEPMISMYATSHDSLRMMVTSFQKGGTKDKEWPSLAPSGVAAYTSAGIPGWKNSILVTSLKHGTITRIILNEPGTAVRGQEVYFKENARYRDVAVSKDGKRIYIVTDRSSATSGPTAGSTRKSDFSGAVIEYTYRQ